MTVVLENQSTNVSACNIFIKKYPRKDARIINYVVPNINSAIYLFFETAHLLKNVGNNFPQYIFPQFNFDDFYDSINLDAREIPWKLLHNVSDRDGNLPCSLKIAYKLTYKSLHLGVNKVYH